MYTGQRKRERKSQREITLLEHVKRLLEEKFGTSDVTFGELEDIGIGVRFDIITGPLDLSKERPKERPQDRKKPKLANLVNKETIKVWTDGGCKNNGTKYAKAGLGVWFGHNDPRNLSERLQGKKQTNNRGELTAIIRAIEIIGVDFKGKIICHTDSTYCKDGIQKWIHGWKKNGWKKSNGKPVLNKDLWVQFDKLRNQVDIDFVWVEGHSGEQGNEEADKLATKGCFKTLNK